MRFIVGAVLVACVCTPAHAEDRAKAEAVYRAAKQHYELGEYKEALEGFKEAYRNYEDPDFIFNLAQCHRQLGDKQQAVRSYRMFLVKKPDAHNREQVREMIAKLEKQVADEPAGKPVALFGPSSPSDDPQIGPGKPTTPGNAPKDPPGITPDPNPVPMPPDPAPADRPTPIYKRWWLWTAVGAVVAIGVGVGVGVGVSESGKTPSATTDLGTFKF